MAHINFTLPVLKLTQHPVSGPQSVSYLHRVLPGHHSAPVSSQDGIMTVEENADFPQTLEHTAPTSYELERKASVAGWEEVRHKILLAQVEMAGMPVDQQCVVCGIVALFRCQQCGPCRFYCLECFERSHMYINLFHVAEQWENDHFVVVERTINHPDVRLSHQCLQKKVILLECIDEYGTQHTVNFIYCDCEPLVVTLTRAKLWPATSLHPRFSFSFALLDWAEALMLECQVALKDFSSALKFRNPFKAYKGREFYSSLINAFEEYRYLKHQIRHMNFLDGAFDLGNVCPACPQFTQGYEGKFVFAMDALFGLPRKKHAGVSHRNPLFGELFYLDQFSVDQFVQDSGNPKSVSTDCNDFVAGSMIRSATRYKSLDETAVFGYCCRHEFPGRFINLKHGERLAYAVWMLEYIINKHSSDLSQLYMMYDIACTLSHHIKSLNRSDILDRVQLCLPVFHCYGHKVACQVVYGPRRCTGIGLSDGETMERLWSYLRRFSRMTKEMRPSHRIDILTSALIHYGVKTKEKLAHLLLSRFERTLKTKDVAEEVLSQTECATDDIKKWLDDEVASCQFSSSRAKPVQWQRNYFHSLQAYYSLKNQLAAGRNDVITFGQLTWLEKELSECERRNKLSHRWLRSDRQYKELEHSLLFNKKEQILLELWKVSQRRLFLLKLKRKYADGQKIAKKVSLQITKETRLVKSLLEDYSACCTDTDSITVAEALDPIFIEAQLQTLGIWCQTVASGKRREAMDAYLTVIRSEEEICLLKEEAQNIVTYYEERERSLRKAIRQYSENTDTYNRGVTTILHRMLLRSNILLQQGSQVVMAMNLGTCPEEQSSDDSDVESDDTFSDYCS